MNSEDLQLVTSSFSQSMLKLRSSLFQPLLPAVFFLAGVTYDSLTLSRIDRLTDNLILLLYLTILGTLVILTGRFQLGLVPDPIDSSPWHPLSLVHKAQPHFSKGLQFLLGGLFSAYAIFYSQSASFSTTAIFLALIVGLLIANEFFSTQYSSLKLLNALFAIVTLSFLTFFLPVLTGWMNSWVFGFGALLTMAIVWQVARVTLRGNLTPSPNSVFRICLPGFLLIGVCTGLYFLNWIPPIPLSLKFGGMYHYIEKTNGHYTLTYEDGPWYAPWKESNDRMGANDPVYCFSSVFAPVTLETTIYHHWQWRPLNSSEAFSTTDRIPLSIIGGREKGYRLYTMKHHLQPGEWRVNVEVEDGRLLGRMRVHVEENYVPQYEFISLTR